LSEDEAKKTGNESLSPKKLRKNFILGMVVNKRLSEESLLRVNDYFTTY
jgi:hypothetical protein